MLFLFGRLGDIMEFTEKELDQIKYALEYLHDADLSDYGKENIIVMEGAMKNLV